MACVDDPKADSECLSVLTNYNPYIQAGLWSPGESSPSEYGCYGWVYVGRYERLNTFGSMRVYGDPPDVPEDSHTVTYHTSGISDTLCTVNNSNVSSHATEDDKYEYGEPYDRLNNGDLWVDVTHVLYYDYYILIDENGEPDCQPGWEFNPDSGVCEEVCGWEFEILKNVDFGTLTNSTTANEWTSENILYDKNSLSDFAPSGNVAHFGGNQCEWIQQPITTDNGEYRYNPTMLYGIEFSYMDIRSATPDSTFVINIGGHVEIYDLTRIRDEFPLGNTGTEDLYSFQTGEEIFRIELPVPVVNPSALAVAEFWNIGNILTEVTKFGITGYIPCDQAELIDNDAVSTDITCTPIEPDITEYLWQQDLYRRKIVTFETDIQGLIPQYLDKIMVSHSALQWGEAGEVVAVDENILTLSDELVDTTSTKTIVFRNIDGSISGAYGVVVNDAYTIQVAGLPTWVTPKILYTIQDISSAQEFLVTSVVPNGNIVKVECVEYVEEIYK